MNAAIEQPQGEIGGGFDAQERRPQPGSGVAATFDTSGRVACSAQFQPIGYCIWPDLSPFVRGYGSAMAEALFVYLREQSVPHDDALALVAFSNWAPETLARIMEDCAELAKAFEPYRVPTEDDGKTYWELRQRGHLPKDPPRTVYLGDDGKVRFQ